MPAFRMAGRDANGECLTIDIDGADVKSFIESQPALIDRSEKRTVSPIAKRPENKSHIFPREHMRQRLFALDFDLGPDLPTEA